MSQVTITCNMDSKKHFFQQAIKLLKAHKIFGVFPEYPAPLASSDEQLIFYRILFNLSSFLNPLEPLFNQSGWHPAIVY